MELTSWFSLQMSLGLPKIHRRQPEPWSAVRPGRLPGERLVTDVRSLDGSVASVPLRSTAGSKPAGILDDPAAAEVDRAARVLSVCARQCVLHVADPKAVFHLQQGDRGEADRSAELL